ncbi:hypothetical protein TH66_10080 [Carbonactinospora thermoautotrophica]|uniref:Uncharacterized protein n=2 Tax=Carbonactinospora thermoautotrophica TaxID=1469144 RepID=A0A132N291_9ACTN|nr:hypothetical protein TH66_10080 [Carbonactinospora thermoautotrophica]
MKVVDRGVIRAALLSVPGVANAEVRPDRRAGGVGTLRLEVDPGADRVAVAEAVRDVLRQRFRLGVDAAALAAAEGPGQARLTPLMDELDEPTPAMTRPAAGAGVDRHPPVPREPVPVPGPGAEPGEGTMEQPARTAGTPYGDTGDTAAGRGTAADGLRPQAFPSRSAQTPRQPFLGEPGPFPHSGGYDNPAGHPDGEPEHAPPSGEPHRTGPVPDAASGAHRLSGDESGLPGGAYPGTEHGPISPAYGTPAAGHAPAGPAHPEPPGGDAPAAEQPEHVRRHPGWPEQFPAQPGAYPAPPRWPGQPGQPGGHQPAPEQPAPEPAPRTAPEGARHTAPAGRAPAPPENFGEPFVPTPLPGFPAPAAYQPSAPSAEAPAGDQPYQAKPATADQPESPRQQTGPQPRAEDGLPAPAEGTLRAAGHPEGEPAAEGTDPGGSRAEGEAAAAAEERAQDIPRTPHDHAGSGPQWSHQTAGSRAQGVDQVPRPEAGTPAVAEEWAEARPAHAARPDRPYPADWPGQSVPRAEAALTRRHPAEPLRDHARLALDAVEVTAGRLAARATVRLVAYGRVYTGECDAPVIRSSMNKAVSRATLRAVEAATGQRVCCETEQLEIVTYGLERVVLVVVSMATSRHNDLVAGAAVVRGDLRYAVARATLDAVNRRVEPLVLQDRDETG